MGSTEPTSHRRDTLNVLRPTKTEARFTILFSRFFPSESLLSRFAHKAFGSYLSKTVASCMPSWFPEVRCGLRWWCKWFLLTEIVAVRDGGGMRMEWVVTWIQMEPVPERHSARRAHRILLSFVHPSCALWDTAWCLSKFSPYIF